MGATNVLSFAPQVSIDPEIVGEFDKRYLRYFTKKNNSGMEIKPEDVSGRVYVFFDPFLQEDKRHIELLKGVVPSVFPIAIRFTHHFPIQCFANSKDALSLMKLVRIDDHPSIKAIAYRNRRNVNARFRFLPELVAKRSPERARRVADLIAGRVTSDESADQLFCVAKAFADKGSLYDACACMLKASQKNPSAIIYLRELSKLYSRMEEHGKAQEYAERAISLNRSDGHLFNLLAGAQLAGGRAEEAEKSLLHAISLVEHPDFYSRLSRISLGRGDNDAAVRYAKKAVECGKDNENAHVVFVIALDRTGNKSEVNDVLNLALSKWPNNKRLIQMRDGLSIKK